MSGGLSRTAKKYIASLSVKKYRDREKCFLVEGEKSVAEFIASDFKVKAVYCTGECSVRFSGSEIISAAEMRQISNLKTASPVLAVVEIPVREQCAVSRDELVLVLDDVQDPGNLGTIIRLAEWFGIKRIVCSPRTADAYGPKTVQASMGSMARAEVTYTDLRAFFATLDSDIPVYGTFLEGENIYDAKLSSGGVVAIGNEGNGISPEIAEFVSRRLFIPPFGSRVAESLNVAVAAAIVCSEFRRSVSHS
ncbi:MAG: RNA methyltransferase [Prevotellaceae bacterium]|jgi:TrmH family RNA methyltransferase|nr:RNA methyltransferase [Prevotellaceae bacterium]